MQRIEKLVFYFNVALFATVTISVPLIFSVIVAINTLECVGCKPGSSEEFCSKNRDTEELQDFILYVLERSTKCSVHILWESFVQTLLFAVFVFVVFPIATCGTSLYALMFLLRGCSAVPVCIIAVFIVVLVLVLVLVKRCKWSLGR